MSEACSDLDMPVLVLDGSDWPVLVLDALIGHSILSGSERTHISQQSARLMMPNDKKFYKLHSCCELKKNVK